MLADEGEPLMQSGALAVGLHLTGLSLIRLIDFIASELPQWRDRADRKPVASETALTSQLCAHLNSAARRSRWDFLQFRTEEPDEATLGRKIDLVPAPSNSVVWVNGRRHVDFDPLIPVECKRLPTPAGAKRDKREYLFSRHSTTGGVARFKAGHHGAHHSLAAMIAYVQSGSTSQWHSKIGYWVGALARARIPGWSKSDYLHLDRHDSITRIALLRSRHTRSNALPDIDLRHLWIEVV